MERVKLKDRRYFDEKKIPRDVWSVLRTSSVLSVGEFRVFEIAYETWYGEKGDEKTIEGYFIPYMFGDIVPMWVRHFCKHVLQLDEEDKLDPVDFGIVRRQATKEQISKGVEYILWIVVLFILMFVALDAMDEFVKLHCMFPPCY